MKATLLHDWHVRHGAKMAPFGGYDMPLWYPTGAKNEHLSVITAAGLFDTSHMAVVSVEGHQARELLQLCFSRDLDACIGKSKGPLKIGHCAYGVFLNDRGEVIDDAIVYQLQPEQYMIVVNAGMGSTVAAHLEANRATRSVVIVERSDKVGKMDLQGPAAAKIMGRLLRDPQAVFGDLTYFTFKGYFEAKHSLAAQVCLTDGTPLMLSRTGYTGEFGFEIFVELTSFQKVWDAILTAGQGEGLVVCGLAARDSLRGGAVLPLSHQDIGAWPFMNNPWMFALPLKQGGGLSFTKKFIGADALQKAVQPKYTYAFAGFDSRKVFPHDGARVTNLDGKPIGDVLTCVTDVAIDRHNGKIYSVGTKENPAPRGLCCGFVLVTEPLQVGQNIKLADPRRSIEVEVVTDIRPGRTARNKITALY